MIYVMHAVGSSYIKVGKASGQHNLAMRLVSIQVGCPYLVRIVVAADWPDAQERRIHTYLKESRVRGEWFMESERSSHIIRFMGLPNGLELFQAIPVHHRRRSKV